MPKGKRTPRSDGRYSPEVLWHPSNSLTEAQKDGAHQNGKEEPETFLHPVKEIFGGRIPGVLEFTSSLAEAQEKGMLFFLAIEFELLLDSYLEQNVMLPTSVELEILLAEAVQALKGDYPGLKDGGSR